MEYTVISTVRKNEEQLVVSFNGSLYKFNSWLYQYTDLLTVIRLWHRPDPPYPRGPEPVTPSKCCLLYATFDLQIYLFSFGDNGDEFIVAVNEG